MSAPPPMRPVYSSHVDSIGYDEEANELYVRYQTGRLAIYQAVPPLKAAQVMGAPSIGGALHALVRGRHRHRYGDDGE